MVSKENPRARPSNAKRTATAAAFVALMLAPLGALVPSAAADGVSLTLSTPLAEVTTTHEANFTVAGVVSPSNCSVEVNGHAVDVDSLTGAFHVTITLEPGNNTVRVVACPDILPQTVVERVIVREESSVSLTIDAPAHELVTNETSVIVS